MTLNLTESEKCTLIEALKYARGHGCQQLGEAYTDLGKVSRWARCCIRITEAHIDSILTKLGAPP